MECPICGSLTTRKARGPLPTYCSAKCRRRADYLRRAPAELAKSRAATAAERASVTKACRACGGAFSPEKNMRQAYCSDKCRSRATRDTPSRACITPGCDRPHRAKGLCNMHYKAALRAEGRIKADPWGDRRRANYQKRRALKKGAAAERIVPLEVFERDGWLCGICSDVVDPERAYPDPLSPSLDHILPLSMGGAHSLANTQLAHLGCNVRKGARVD